MGAIELLQEIKGKHTESHNEAGHRKPEVPEVIVVGLIECVGIPVALVHTLLPPRPFYRTARHSESALTSAAIEKLPFAGM